MANCQTARLYLLHFCCRAEAVATSNGTTAVPEPVVKIDNQSDAFATVVTVEFGDRLGELLDTVSTDEGVHTGAPIVEGSDSLTVRFFPITRLLSSS